MAPDNWKFSITTRVIGIRNSTYKILFEMKFTIKFLTPNMDNMCIPDKHNKKGFVNTGKLV